MTLHAVGVKCAIDASYFTLAFCLGRASADSLMQFEKERERRKKKKKEPAERRRRREERRRKKTREPETGTRKELEQSLGVNAFVPL